MIKYGRSGFIQHVLDKGVLSSKRQRLTEFFSKRDHLVVL